MSTYEIIAKPFPRSRKKEFFLNLRDGLSFAFFRYLPKGPKPPQVRWTTASSREEAITIALKILMSGHGFESVVIQDPQDPESGAIELYAEKKANPESTASKENRGDVRVALR